MIPYEKNIAKYVMMPGNAKRRHPVVEERTRKLAQWAETAPVNRVEEGADHKIGIITSSTSYQYVKEVCGDRFPVLKLGMGLAPARGADPGFCRLGGSAHRGGGAGRLHRGPLPGDGAGPGRQGRVPLHR